jgi:hypothetical protein
MSDAMKIRIPPHRAVVVAVCTLAVSYMVFWACAPTATLPPPVPFAADERSELSVGGSLGVGDPGRVLRGEGWNHMVFELGYAEPAVGAQVSWVFEPRPGLSFGAQGYLGNYMIAGGGVTLRYLGQASERFAIGVAGQVGWLYGYIGMPISVRVGERTWLWTQPSAGLSFMSIAQVPLGVSYVSDSAGVFSVEASVRALGYVEEYYAQIGFGWSRRFPRRR